MALTQLTNLTGYEVSLVPKGANKKRFLVVKENNGDSEMNKKLLERILKEGLKDEDAVAKVAKNLGMSEDETEVLKAVMKLVGEGGMPAEKLMKAMKEMGYEVDKMEDEEEEKEKNTEKEDDPSKKKDEEVNKEQRKGGDVKVPVQKEDGSWDLSGVDESLRPVMQVICKSNEQLAKALNDQKTANVSLAEKLKTEKDARVLKEFEEKAISFGHLGQDAKNLAKVLKAAHEADPENGAAIEEILKSANAKIEQSNLFAEKGTTGSGFGKAGAGAWSKIEKMAQEISKSDPKVSSAEAIELVLKKHPELYDEYTNEKRRA